MSDLRNVHVALAERSYDIVIGTGTLGEAANYVTSFRGTETPGTALVVTDENVHEPHAEAVAKSLQSAGWNLSTHMLSAGERAKSLTSLAEIYDALVELRADRRSLVVAVGGGVVGDAAGFAAATYNRGMPFVQVPTTLLAMVDSSVGGKTGVNHPKGKNLIGAFHQPIGVLIDPEVLATLPKREYRGGLAEVVKYGVILDAEFFQWLEQNVEAINKRDPAALGHIIERSCRLKADVVEEDEFETTGLRAVLNYGHTFAHAYEALAGYGELSHGEAVSIGMLDASRLAERRGFITAEDTQRQHDLLSKLRLPTALPSGMDFSTDDLIGRMRLDKKNRDGKMRFVLPTCIGEVKLFDDTDEADVRAVLELTEHA
ncbi:3-dehydroquinate synthase [Calycomorphotria hydatis]|uniref:3-dehydroquinate synthase n=1 Tax=Calycomorphotria hydatis TaxID=2528027 RepID=A0A517T3X3_9PLAN|nr:3-dehydroquinate synthase [Calycomorphotria hydatis]QDT63074.1 3-dehydroquinate synthase [Calycomorphotria hydatis]